MCIDTPYYKGEVTAFCCEKPLVDVIVGNITSAKEPACPDSQWVASLALQPRAHAKQVHMFLN